MKERERSLLHGTDGEGKRDPNHLHLPAEWWWICSERWQTCKGGSIGRNGVEETPRERRKNKSCGKQPERREIAKRNQRHGKRNEKRCHDPPGSRRGGSRERDQPSSFRNMTDERDKPKTPFYFPDFSRPPAPIPPRPKKKKRSACYERFRKRYEKENQNVDSVDLRPDFEYPNQETFDDFLGEFDFMKHLKHGTLSKFDGTVKGYPVFKKNF